MKSMIFKSMLVITALAGFFIGPLAANAMTPTLSLSATGSGDYVTVNVYGDSFSNAVLYYQKSGYGMQSQFIGSTDSNGRLSTTLSASANNIIPGGYVYITVNNQQSSQTTWPYYYNGYNGSGYNYNYGTPISLSQTSISLNVGASVNVTIYGGGSYYISTNANSNIASAYVSGNTLAVYGIAYGNDTISICQSGGQCASLYVTVGYNGTNYNNNCYNDYGSNYGYNCGNTYIYGLGTPTLGQTSVSATIGQPAYITISGGNQPYTMYPSNPNIFNSVIGGNTLTISGLNYGSGSLSVCSSAGSASGCTTLYVTVGGQIYNPVVYSPAYNPVPVYNNGQLSLSQTSISVNVGTTANIVINGTGSYYISNNNNSNIASAYISGNNVSVYGVAYGNDTISICQSGGQCASLYVTVNSSGTNYNNNYGNHSSITFSQNNPALSVGQNMSISVYGGTGGNYYVAYNSNSSGVQANISGNILNVTGEANGVAAITICSTSINCSAVNVNVGNY